MPPKARIRAIRPSPRYRSTKPKQKRDVDFFEIKVLAMTITKADCQNGKRHFVSKYGGNPIAIAIRTSSHTYLSFCSTLILWRDSVVQSLRFGVSVQPERLARKGHAFFPSICFSSTGDHRLILFVRERTSPAIFPAHTTPRILAVVLT